MGSPHVASFLSGWTVGQLGRTLWHRVENVSQPHEEAQHGRLGLGAQAFTSRGQLISCQLVVQVICLDNFFTGCKENVLHLIDKSNFEMVRHDITERILLEVDQIYHLACPASPIHYK